MNTLTAPVSRNSDQRVLRMEGIAKSFSGVTSLSGVKLEVACGAVHAVMGENGAGKSTLMKILSGLVQRQNQIAVIGIDAIPDALKAVADGRTVGTVFQDAHGQGKLAVDLAVDSAESKPVKHDNYIPFQLVTKENVANFQK